MYAVLARDGDASDAFFCVVATALAGLAVLVLRAPPPPKAPGAAGLDESLLSAAAMRAGETIVA